MEGFIECPAMISEDGRLDDLGAGDVQRTHFELPDDAQRQLDGLSGHMVDELKKSAVNSQIPLVDEQ
jgi:hypothetical protein